MKIYFGIFLEDIKRLKDFLKVIFFLMSSVSQWYLLNIGGEDLTFYVWSQVSKNDSFLFLLEYMLLAYVEKHKSSSTQTVAQLLDPCSLFLICP